MIYNTNNYEYEKNINVRPIENKCPDECLESPLGVLKRHFICLLKYQLRFQNMSFRKERKRAF